MKRSRFTFDDLDLPDWYEEKEPFMPNEDQTLPPRQPNTLRTWLPRIWAWLTEHKSISIPAGAFIIGLIVGRVL